MVKPHRKSLVSIMGDADANSTSPETEAAVIATPTSQPVKKTTRQVKQTAYLPLAVHRQLRELAFTEEKKMHNLLMEGLDMVFQNRGLRSISELTTKN